MSMIIYIFLLVSSVFLTGCRRAPDSEECRMLEIENLTVAEKTLTLDYRVSNPFEQDIWVCEDIDDYSIDHVETRIDAETVWIKLHSNLECNVSLEIGLLAKYRLLSPGESYSGKILLNLPITNASPVYHFDEDHKKHKQVFLQRAVFEVGYFEGKHINRISVTMEKIKRKMPIEDLQNTQFNFRIEEEIKDSQSRKFLYWEHTWPVGSREKSAKVVVTDVDIPCSVAVEDEYGQLGTVTYFCNKN